MGCGKYLLHQLSKRKNQKDTESESLQWWFTSSFRLQCKFVVISLGRVNRFVKFHFINGILLNDLVLMLSLHDMKKDYPLQSTTQNW